MSAPWLRNAFWWAVIDAVLLLIYCPLALRWLFERLARRRPVLRV